MQNTRKKNIKLLKKKDEMEYKNMFANKQAVVLESINEIFYRDIASALIKSSMI